MVHQSYESSGGVDRILESLWSISQLLLDVMSVFSLFFSQFTITFAYIRHHFEKGHLAEDI